MPAICTRCLAESILSPKVNYTFFSQSFKCVSACDFPFGNFLHRSEVEKLIREKEVDDSDAISWIAFAGSNTDKDLLFQMLQQESTESLDLLRRCYTAKDNHVVLDYILPILVARSINF